jgi:putative sigma-54 modulation protein
MKVEMNGRHFDLTDGLKDHVEKKLATLEKFHNGIDDVHVILEFATGTNQVHIQLRGDRIKLDARGNSHDMYAAFDGAFESLEGQMRKFKDRHHGHPHRKKENGGNGLTSTFFIPAEDSEFDGGILLDDSVEVPRLRTADAVVEFEMADTEHLVFQNMETDTLSLVYTDSSGDSQVVELVESST